jgi:uncharacterized alpha-E superfamily protein
VAAFLVLKRFSRPGFRALHAQQRWARKNARISREIMSVTMWESLEDLWLRDRSALRPSQEHRAPSQGAPRTSLDAFRCWQRLRAKTARPSGVQL